MLHLNHTVEILTGGTYTGNRSWNKKRSEIDNCFKIYYITKGHLFICEDEKEYMLREGQCYFINGSRLVTQYCRESFSTHWLHFIPKNLIIHQALLSMPLVCEYPAELPDSMQPIVKASPLIAGQPATSYKEHCIQSLNLQNFIQSAIVRILEQNPWNTPQVATINNIIAPAIHYIDAHFTQQIRLEELASCCCMSPSYFHKIFTQTLQITPANYITRLRMNATLPLLADDTYSIKEISYQLGYCTDAYFSRTFKSYYGITPGNYRKKREGLLF